MVFFRVDGNDQIGMGHVMRCLAIAEAVRSRGRECGFLVADDSAAQLIEGRGFSTVCLDSHWKDLEAELPTLKAFFIAHEHSTLLVDSYFVTEKYMACLAQSTRLLYIDDTGDYRWKCAGLINYNLDAKMMQYDGVCSKEMMLLGSKYAPLRKEFQNQKIKKTSRVVKDVLITVGGADSDNISGKIIEEAKRDEATKGLSFHIVLGEYNKNVKKMEKLSRINDGIFLYQKVDNMSALMRKCDVAVSAGGVTLYELAACGTPTVCFAWVTNQIQNVTSFGKRELMINAGDIRGHDLAGKRIVNSLKKLCNNEELRTRMSFELQKTVDGEGANRVADILISTG